MLVVGLFAVLSWDSMFPNRRDVLVLAPLPVRAQTLFAAKVAALGAALSLTVVALHGLNGILWPMMLTPAHYGFLELIFSVDLYRSFAAYWITMFAAGGFIFCSVLTLQGLAAQLPRRVFLRLSALLQVAALCIFVSVYFLQPSLASPKALAAPENQGMLAWLPSYWFLGLFQSLNGSMHPAMIPLARRAWMALAIAVSSAIVAYALSYFRTLRRIVEEPDILPTSRPFGWFPRCGDSLSTVLMMFSVRTLSRSRQHRMILAFYLGLGFAAVILFTNALFVRAAHVSDTSLLIASLVMMGFAVAGTRAVFSMPIELRAHWIFRVTQIREPKAYLASIRRPLFVLGVAPVWLLSAAVFLSIWPWRQAAGHLLILGLWGSSLAYLSLYRFRKIPFTCSYLPGKSNLQMAFLASIAIFMLIDKGVAFEQHAAGSEDMALQFEEAHDAAVQALGLIIDRR